MSVINDERDLHIDLAQNTLQSRLVQILSNKFHQHHRQRKSLSLFFILLSLTRAFFNRDTKKKKKLARFGLADSGS